MASNPAVHGKEVPDSPHVVTASPSVGGPPQEDWDATSNAVISGWKPVDGGSGPADRSGTVTAPFPDSGRWLQT
jgi:hypothetical protein